MKKVSIIIIIITLILTLVGCDFDEKSFQSLNRDEIPTEVTRDFVLPRGIYGRFIWESDNDALIIDGNNVTVNQKEEDITVVITATVNKKSESFTIIVLNKNSERSWREKGEDAIVEMRATYNEIDDSNLKLPKQYEDLYIRYYLSDKISKIGYYEDDENLYISSGFNASNNNITINISFYKDSDFNNIDNHVYHSYLTLYANKLKAEDIYIKTLEEININKYHKSFKYDFYLEVGDVIEFSDSENADIKLDFYNDESLIKITNTKYQLTKPIEGVSYAKGYLTITINNMPKSILITVHNKSNTQ